MASKLNICCILAVAIAMMYSVTLVEGRRNARIWIPAPALGTVKPAPAPAPTPSTVTPSENVALQLINSFRYTHQAPPVTYSTTLAAQAATCVRTYVATNPGPVTAPLPRPVCAGSPTAGTALANNEQATSNGVRAGISDPTGGWFAQYINNAGAFPPQAQASYNAAYQDYTQMIWVASTQVGCAWSPTSITVTGANPQFIFLCLFTPQGNVPATFPQNVLADV